jgi:hypothetical protein
MKKIFPLFILLVSVNILAQQNQIQITKIVGTDKQDPLDVFQCNFKLLKGKAENHGTFGYFQNNILKSIVKLEIYEPILVGKESKYPEIFYVIGEGLKVGATLISLEAAIPKNTASQSFSFNTNMAFLGYEKNTFGGIIKELKGALKLGDTFEYKNFKGEVSTGSITKISLASNFEIPFLPEELAIGQDVAIDVVTEKGLDFSNAIVSSKTGSMVANKLVETSMPKNIGKIKTIPVNLTLKNNEYKLTVHNLIKFNPDPASKGFDVFKIDYSLDYYIVDATIENISKKDLDSGELMLRFNFFDKKGQSADEFLRIFKEKNGEKDDIKKQANALDKMVFGGSSKLKLSQVMAKYIESIPDYDKKHKSDSEAIFQAIKTGQKVHSIAATLMGVPPSYKIEGIGTWSGTFFDKKNLVWTELKL